MVVLAGSAWPRDAGDPVIAGRYGRHGGSTAWLLTVVNKCVGSVVVVVPWDGGLPRVRYLCPRTAA
jgi:hypothetical protein